MGNTQLRFLIVTADDLGSSASGIERIIEAHTDGVLTSASLMVAAPAAEAAVRAAREHPGLAVGLHLVLCDGRAALDHAEAPDLVDGRMMLRRNPTSAGIAYAFSRTLRRQLRAEIAEQFERFAATGLACDHVDGHHHLHIHPVAWREIMRLAPTIGVTAIRAPREAGVPAIWRSPRAAVRSATLRAVSTWCVRSALRAGMRVPDLVLGIADSGGISEGRLTSLLRYATGRVTELYMHPGDSEAEARALCSRAVRSEVKLLGLRCAPWHAIAQAWP